LEQCFWGGKNILDERHSNIETAIQEAERRSREAAALSEAQQKVTQAQAEARTNPQALKKVPGSKRT